MNALIMPKAIAVWLIDNTALTFKQIADFTDLHHLEVQAIADGDVAGNIVGTNPVLKGVLQQEELDKAEKDSDYLMKKSNSDVPQPKRRGAGPKYTPVTKRADKPDGIAYLIKNYPDFTDAMIIKLIGTTRNTIGKIRDRSHPRMSSIKPRDPVALGLCKRSEMDKMIEKAKAKAARAAKKASKAGAKAEEPEISEEEKKTVEA